MVHGLSTKRCVYGSSDDIPSRICLWIYPERSMCICIARALDLCCDGKRVAKNLDDGDSDKLTIRLRALALISVLLLLFYRILAH